MEWARDHDMKKMVAITKRNILKQTDGIFWNAAVRAAEGTDVEVSEIYIDNMAQQLVVAPEQFNGTVLVSTNLFMDIISELVSGLVGSIGLIYSANMGDDFAMFEAAHGSAPQFAGQNKVNPTAANPFRSLDGRLSGRDCNQGCGIFCNRAGSQRGQGRNVGYRGSASTHRWQMP